MMILLTGASKGIGLALAHEFARHGHDLVLVARDEAKLKEASELLQKQYNVKTHYKVCDLSKVGSSLALYQELKKDSLRINCLVNNAGIGYMGPYAEMSDEKLHDLMQINMISLSELTHLFLKDFISRNEGSILQVASTAAFLPGPLMAAYYASKAYVVSLSHAIAHEVKETNVTISILCPGATKTDFFPEAGMINSLVEKGYSGMMSPEKVAQIAYKGLQKKKLFIIPGTINKLVGYLTAVSPKGLAAAIASYLHHKSE